MVLKLARLYINYTTKSVPELHFTDNERDADFRGCLILCEFARFVCDFAQSAQRF